MGRKIRNQKRSDVIINVSTDPEKKKPDIVQPEKETNETNQFLPGAVALNSFIIIIFLLYLEQKDNIKFSNVLVIYYPTFVRCEDNKNCVLQRKEIELHHTNVTHLFIFILMFVGYLPAHIIYLSNEKNKKIYSRIKNVLVIVLFSVLYAIVQGQNDIVYQLMISVNNLVLFGIGLFMQNNYLTFKYMNYVFFSILFCSTVIQSLPTITARRRGNPVPGFLYALTFFWYVESLIEIVLHYNKKIHYLHLLNQILMSLTYGLFFWDYGKINDSYK